jgi:hypothetical protein
VFADLDPEEEHNNGRWVLDTGATNHMTSVKHFFTELDMQVCGTIRFGDGSVIRIEGRGTIILTCRNGDHQTLMGVYYIMHLKTSIISIGQLDETGCSMNINGGVLHIYDQSQRLLIKVLRSPSRLDLLNVQVGQSVCLAARTSDAAWLWHGQFGHLNFGSLRRLASQGMVR